MKHQLNKSLILENMIKHAGVAGLGAAGLYLGNKALQTGMENIQKAKTSFPEYQHQQAQYQAPTHDGDGNAITQHMIDHAAGY